MDFYEKVRKLARAARFNLQKDGNLKPVIIINTPDRPTFLDAAFKDVIEKGAVATKARKIINQYRADQYIVIAEIWIGTGENDKIAPFQDPNRRDGIMVQGFHSDGRFLMITIPFRRVSDSIIFEKEQESTDPSSSLGFFSNLFDFHGN